jgi:predicted phosphodiesterase
MRVGLLADIHGNALALEAVRADMAGRGPFDAIIAAGDLVWDGPRPAEVVDVLREMGAVALQGNTDALCTRDPAAEPVEDVPNFRERLAWVQEQLGPARIAYLGDLPFSHRISPAPGHDLLVVHANPLDMEGYLVPGLTDTELDAVLPSPDTCDWDVLAFGHYHVPFVRPWRGRTLVNVASCGLPRDGDTRAVYAVLTWDNQAGAWQIEHHRVMYETPVVAYELRTCGLPRGKHFAERLMRASYNPAPR